MASHVANRALVGLRQLWAGRLDDTLLQPVPWGRPRSGTTSSAGKVAERVLEACTARPPPPGRLRGDAALQRLLGDQAAASTGPRDHNSTFEKLVEKLARNPKQPLPRKGDHFPSHWRAVDLPEPGERPVDICKLSPRCRDFLENFRERMLKQAWEEAVKECPTKPFMDPHFRSPSNLFQLAAGMGRAGMLRRVSRRHAGVTLFTVIKRIQRGRATWRWPSA